MSCISKVAVLRSSFALSLTSLSSCLAPNSGYFESPMTVQQSAASREFINQIERESAQFRHEERMSEASAAAVVNASLPPTHINPNPIIIVR
jgi:hypothetical protein